MNQIMQSTIKRTIQWVAILATSCFVITANAHIVEGTETQLVIMDDRVLVSIEGSGAALRRLYQEPLSEPIELMDRFINSFTLQTPDKNCTALTDIVISMASHSLIAEGVAKCSAIDHLNITTSLPRASNIVDLHLLAVSIGGRMTINKLHLKNEIFSVPVTQLKAMWK